MLVGERGLERVSRMCPSQCKQSNTRECNTCSPADTSCCTLAHIAGKLNQVIKDTQAPLPLSSRPIVLLWGRGGWRGEEVRQIHTSLYNTHVQDFVDTDSFGLVIHTSTMVTRIKCMMQSCLDFT